MQGARSIGVYGKMAIAVRGVRKKHRWVREDGECYTQGTRSIGVHGKMAVAVPWAREKHRWAWEGGCCAVGIYLGTYGAKMQMPTQPTPIYTPGVSLLH